MTFPFLSKAMVYAPVCTTNPQIFTLICYIHLHIHHMSRILFLILSFLDFVVFEVRTLIFPKNQRWKCAISSTNVTTLLLLFKRAIIAPNNTIGNFLVKSRFETSDEPGTFKCARARCILCPFIHNVVKISVSKRSIKIIHHFTCTSANVIYRITFYSLQKVIHRRNRKTTTRPIPRASA